MRRTECGATMQRIIFRSLAALVMFNLFAPSLRGDQQETGPGHYQKIVDQAEWDWHDDQASIVHSILECRAPYQIELVHEPETQGDRVTIRFSKGAHALWSWEGHWLTVFIVSGSTLVYADYDMTDSGCKLIAVDFHHSKELWRTEVGFPATSHLWYKNRVIMHQLDNAVVIRGNEAGQRYMAIVDIATGKVLGRKTFPRAESQ